MVPPKQDPKWTKLINNLESVQSYSLSTRLMLSKLKLTMTREKSSDASKKQSIAEAYDYFTKNEANLKDDIKLIFG